MKQRKRITLQTDVNATCAIRHTLALSVLGLGFLVFPYKTNGKPVFLRPDLGPFWGWFWGSSWASRGRFKGKVDKSESKDGKR